MLSLAGCTHVQGYLFSPAVPEVEVAGLLRSMPAIIDTVGRGSGTADILPVEVVAG